MDAWRLTTGALLRDEIAGERTVRGSFRGVAGGR